jgi:hypothetical protein
MNKLRVDEPIDATAASFAADAAARSRIEQLAMLAVQRTEELRGCRVVDVSAAKCGWDLSSYPPAIDGRQPDPRHIEVKGRVKGASTVTVTRNEMLYAFNQGKKFVLAIALVGEDDTVDSPHYVSNPFDREPGWGVASHCLLRGSVTSFAASTSSAFAIRPSTVIVIDACARSIWPA